MLEEQGFPPVESGDSDPCALTDGLHTGTAHEIIPQNQEDEAQGGGRIGHQCAGEEGVGVSRTSLILEVTR